MLRVCCVVVLASFTASNHVTPLLSKLNIDPKGISISGLSSGADFAAQFQVAYSSLLVGSGVFAGQPWRCAVTRFTADAQVPICQSQHNDCNTVHPAPSVPFCDGCDNGLTLIYDHCKASVILHINVILTEQTCCLA
jgi:hypothetical protein